MPATHVLHLLYAQPRAGHDEVFLRLSRIACTHRLHSLPSVQCAMEDSALKQIPGHPLQMLMPVSESVVCLPERAEEDLIVWPPTVVLENILCRPVGSGFSKRDMYGAPLMDLPS